MQTSPCSNHDLLNHVLLNHPCPTPTSCSNHTLPKPCPNVAPAQCHTLLSHAHPLLYLTNPCSTKPCPKPYSTPPCPGQPSLLKPCPAQPCSTHSHPLLNPRPAPTKPCPNLASIPCYITPTPAQTTPCSYHALLKPRPAQTMPHPAETSALVKLLPRSKPLLSSNSQPAHTIQYAQYIKIMPPPGTTPFPSNPALFKSVLLKNPAQTPTSLW